MNESILIPLIVFLLAGLAIAAAKLYDLRQDALRREILEEGIRVRGIVGRVERDGWMDARTPFPWRIDVDFEYEGKSYSLEQRCRYRPVLREGDSVTVYVYRKDPWKSRFIA